MLGFCAICAFSAKQPQLGSYAPCVNLSELQVKVRTVQGRCLCSTGRNFSMTATARTNNAAARVPDGTFDAYVRTLMSHIDREGPYGTAAVTLGQLVSLPEMSEALNSSHAVLAKVACTPGAWPEAAKNSQHPHLLAHIITTVTSTPNGTHPMSIEYSAVVAASTLISRLHQQFEQHVQRLRQNYENSFDALGRPFTAEACKACYTIPEWVFETASVAADINSRHIVAQSTTVGQAMRAADVARIHGADGELLAALGRHGGAGGRVEFLPEDLYSLLAGTVDVSTVSEMRQVAKCARSGPDVAHLASAGYQVDPLDPVFGRAPDTMSSPAGTPMPAVIGNSLNSLLPDGGANPERHLLSLPIPEGAADAGWTCADLCTTLAEVVEQIAVNMSETVLVQISPPPAGRVKAGQKRWAGAVGVETNDAAQLLHRRVRETLAIRINSIVVRTGSERENMHVHRGAAQPFSRGG